MQYVRFIVLNEGRNVLIESRKKTISQKADLHVVMIIFDFDKARINILKRIFLITYPFS